MAFNDLYPIKIYSGNNTIGRLNSSRRKLANRIISDQGNGFQNILAGFRTRNSNNIRWGFETTSNKTRGLTIADYRTRPVISKSRCRPQLKPPTAELKNTVTNRFSERRTPAAIHKEPLRNPCLSGQDLKKVEFVESTTTRKAGGLDFTARGGKRQGHAVPQSLRVWKTQIPDKTANQQPAILTNRQIIAQNVQKAAAKYSLPPALINAVIRAESNFKAKAVSSAGAQGLMQLMPATAKELGVKNSFDIAQNIDGGAKYLRKMLDRFGGNVRTALAAYNAGPGTVIKYNGRVPYAETRQYVKRVLRFSKQMA
jgi:hypothetical protein